MIPSDRKALNVLCLDGGGVRGLSTLLIMQELMRLINEVIKSSGTERNPLIPRDVFDLVVGTSTGGLIALMLVKLGFDIETCITKYEKLSKEIFRRWQLKAYYTLGFGRHTRYNGNHLQKVVIDEVLGQTRQAYCMEEVDDHPHQCCAVVCRELTKGGRRKAKAFLLCSHRDEVGPRPSCRHSCRGVKSPNVQVAMAARATSAAPTYFEEIEILGKRLVDGGFGETNNPSMETLSHFFSKSRSQHKLRFVNIGTGSKPADWDDKEEKKKWYDYIPIDSIRNAVHTFGDVLEIATASDTIGEQMQIWAGFRADFTGGRVQFSRFSADEGCIHEIGLDKHDQLESIRQKTMTYLAKASVKEDLSKLALELAKPFISSSTTEQSSTNVENETQQVETNTAQASSPRDSTVPDVHVDPPSPPSAMTNEVQNRAPLDRTPRLSHESSPDTATSSERPCTPTGNSNHKVTYMLSPVQDGVGSDISK